MKIITTLLLLLAFFIKGQTQTWQYIYSDDKVEVESAVIKCNPNNKVHPFSFLILKFTNKTNSELDFYFDYELWYNDVKKNENENDTKVIQKHIHFLANETKQGDCNSDKTYKVFYQNNHPKMNQKLTDFKIIANKTK